MSELRRHVANSRFAPVAALPSRVRSVVRHDGRVLRESAVWLLRSREHTNYTYHLTDRNLRHLACWASLVSGVPVQEARSFIDEVLQDHDLRDRLRTGTAGSNRRGLADREIRYGRRVGWYALVRILRPRHVVETGTDKGLGSCVLAAALLRNGEGHLTTIDVNPSSGYLMDGLHSSVATRIVGDSVATLRRLGEPVDLFLHDSLHTFEHETAELEAVAPQLGLGARVLSDNAHGTDALMDWAERTGRSFLFFDERPSRHWYSGAGIGAAWAHWLERPTPSPLDAAWSSSDSEPGPRP
jgi:hypothetical protein